MRLGIIGTGRIAGRFVKEIEYVEGADLTAIYNPHEGSADRFVIRHFPDAEERHGHSVPIGTDQPELFWDNVDAVYIASTHETHYTYTMEALRHGKHVLCEKPLCLKDSEAKEAFSYAKEHHLILFEAVKTAYCPGFLQLLKEADSGIIGEIRNVEACFTKLENPGRRELTDKQYGGSFTELGSYVMLPALKLLGTEYQNLHFDSIVNDSGIDLFTRATMIFPGGMATLTCGLGVKSEGRLLISGTLGYLIAEAPWWLTNHFEAHFEDTSVIKSYENEFLGDGLRYEIRDFLYAIQTGDRGYSGLTSEESVAMASIMEAFLSSQSR